MPAGSSHGESYTPGAAAGSSRQKQEEAGSVGVPTHPAPRPPWLRPGAGIEDPAVWSVKKCQQLLGQMLLRATGAKFPPIWKDLQLMQVGHCTVCVGAAWQLVNQKADFEVCSLAPMPSTNSLRLKPRPTRCCLQTVSMLAGACRQPGPVCSHSGCCHTGAHDERSPGSGQPEAAGGVALCAARGRRHTAPCCVALSGSTARAHSSSRCC